MAFFPTHPEARLLHLASTRLGLVLASLAFLGLAIAPAAAQQEFVETDSLSSGLVTSSQLDDRPPSLRVTWIRWDSGFRGTGLEIGDRIVAVGGVPVERPADLREIQRRLPRMIGQHAESQEWVSHGLAEGAPISIAVLRRRLGAEGWERLEFEGVLRNRRRHVGERGRPTLGPGGPEELASDGFGEAWASWYEDRVESWSRVLDHGWHRAMSSRYELSVADQDAPRIEHLVARHPGPFASAVLADWEAVRASLAGRPIELAPDALDYRRLGEERIAEIAEAAGSARRAFLERHAADRIDFPTTDPIEGDVAAIAGKLVELPIVRNRDWVVDLGRGILTASEGGRWLFVEAASPGLDRAYRGLRRYQALVTPGIREELAIIGRILDERRMLVVGGRAVTGFLVEPVAVTFGGTSRASGIAFVDLTRADAEPGRVAFAGEERLAEVRVPELAPDASPGAVMETFVAALEAGDQATWRSLFATWRVRILDDDGRAIYNPRVSYRHDEDWLASRRLVAGEVCDARVLWVGEPTRILDGTEFAGAPVVEEVPVEIEHVGLFDGEYRTFLTVKLHRLWILQRIDGGPWRIASIQGL